MINFTNSLIYIFSSHKAVFFLLTIISVLFTQFFISAYKNKIKKDYNKQKSSLTKLEDIEKISIDYYSKNQNLDIFRFVFYFAIISISLLVFDIKAFSIFAIAIGAFIIILKDPITSIISYFFLVSQYDIGNDIRINTILGEIVKIKPFYLGLAGKDESGDYNGKFFVIPNHLFFGSIIERQELKTDHYRRVILTFLYKREEHNKQFKDWIDDLRKKLEELLPNRNLRQVGNYKGYAGFRYKLNYDYDEDGFVSVKLSFISKPGKPAIERKEEIIDYIEGTKKDAYFQDKLGR